MIKKQKKEKKKLFRRNQSAKSSRVDFKVMGFPVSDNEKSSNSGDSDGSFGEMKKKFMAWEREHEEK